MSSLLWQGRSILARNFVRLARFILPVLITAIAQISPAVSTAAQDQSPRALAQRSAIVVRGKVLKVNASDEPMLAASRTTVVILVEQMYAGSEIAGDQTGHTVTVILHRPGSVKVADELTFFGNPRLQGKTLTIANEGEIAVPKGAAAMLMSEVEAGIQARKDAPTINRLATANLVFRGAVERVQPLTEILTAAKEKTVKPLSEHDPEWQVADVRIVTPIRGGEPGQVVAVMFPASRDIMWFHSPKLKVGTDAIFIAQLVNNEDPSLSQDRSFAALEQRQPVYFVTEPADVLDPTDLEHVRSLMTSAKETKR
jgi:hypothetical protein